MRKYFTSGIILILIGAGNILGQNKVPIYWAPKVKDTVALELEAAPFKRYQLSAIGGAFGNRFVGIYSALQPIEIYQLKREKFRYGILAPPVAGGSLFAVLAIGFTSMDGFNFTKKYASLLFLPAYLLNPEIRLTPIQQFQIYSGYTYDLVQDKRTRPIFATKAGAILEMRKDLPGIRIGYENIYYRNNRIGLISGSIILKFESNDK
jgi:hypothetical protein